MSMVVGLLNKKIGSFEKKKKSEVITFVYQSQKTKSITNREK